MLRYTGEHKMIKGFILSLQFFSRIPVYIPIDFNEKNIGYSIFFMPLVGGIIGGLGGGIYHLLYPYNKLMASFISLLTTIVLTGGLHIDGLSDTFDGFMAGKDKEKTLEIMKDSRIGTFGALSIILIVLFKIILIVSIENLPVAMILSFVNSRMAASIIISYKKSAKSDGIGELFNRSNPKRLITGLVIIYASVLILFDIKYLIPLITTFLMGEYISYLSYKKIGGLAGDVYGCIIELGEVISLLTFWGLAIWI